MGREFIRCLHVGEDGVEKGEVKDNENIKENEKTGGSLKNHAFKGGNGVES